MKGDGRNQKYQRAGQGILGLRAQGLKRAQRFTIFCIYKKFEFENLIKFFYCFFFWEIKNYPASQEFERKNFIFHLFTLIFICSSCIGKKNKFIWTPFKWDKTSRSRSGKAAHGPVGLKNEDMQRSLFGTLKRENKEERCREICEVSREGKERTEF